MKSLNKIKKKMKKWVKDKDENVSFARVISLVHIMILLAIVLFVLLLFWIDSVFGIENIARMLQELLSFFQTILIDRFDLLKAGV
ncbi:hypothetical protein [Candidatus Nitrosotenuis cloacae]|uniref:Uncharacterized protein n=1 Tax=Candidatus Nitrosotenuis cloacae TaxID=1603555 RepID=A0A3G1B238_9ARCH|nr:hypothetical protein [Candidatus Nitrosotenuis cloacae]AJZ76196.1 hypothetical protein SU86_007275 [Candidatus Nitrosotenuis cloacae]